MENKKINFRDHPISFILFPLIIGVSVISYYRFFVNNDYLVGYNGVCDPSINRCFIECEDDTCGKDVYYSHVIKYAPDLYSECGKDITNCENANMCLSTDRHCSVTYCNPEVLGATCTEPIQKLTDNKDNNI